MDSIHLPAAISNNNKSAFPLLIFCCCCCMCLSGCCVCVCFNLGYNNVVTFVKNQGINHSHEINMDNKKTAFFEPEYANDSRFLN